MAKIAHVFIWNPKNIRVYILNFRFDDNKNYKVEDREQLKSTIN